MKFLTSSIIIAIMTTSSVSYAASTGTAQVLLKGVVETNCTLAVTPTSKASNLSILNGESGAVVGNVTENCNSGIGYTVSLTSSNSGNLMSNAVGSSPTVYQASFDDGTGAIASEIKTTRSTAQFDRKGDLKISFAANPQAIAGDYSDTMNLTIAAK
jgi:hypothetical protein